MAIDKINNDIQSRQIIQSRVNEATSGKKEKLQDSVNLTKGTNLEDKVTFSQDAKKLQEIEAILQNSLQKLSELDEINSSNLVGIQDKIDSDFYSQKEVAEKVVGEIFSEQELRRTIEVRMKAESYIPELNKLDANSYLDQAKISHIKEKVASGFYNSREVAESIAEGLVSLLDF